MKNMLFPLLTKKRINNKDYKKTNNAANDVDGIEGNSICLYDGNCHEHKNDADNNVHVSG